MLLVTVLCPCDWAQEASNVFGGLNSEALGEIVASRAAAQKELAAKASTFDTPGIANALGFEHYLIVVARISSVRLPTDADGRTIIAFHVEQLLRGESEVSDFRVESRWNPRKAKSLIDTDFNYRETALDKSEPRVGDRYILGYTLIAVQNS